MFIAVVIVLYLCGLLCLVSSYLIKGVLTFILELKNGVSSIIFKNIENIDNLEFKEKSNCKRVVKFSLKNRYMLQFKKLNNTVSSLMFGEACQPFQFIKNHESRILELNKKIQSYKKDIVES